MNIQRPDSHAHAETTTPAPPPARSQVAYKDPREHVTARAVGVWLVALLTYIVAITGRTSLGVAGVEALGRFHINASQLAVFTAVQVGVYAFAQIPTGIIIDRVGAKKTMVAGALIMAAGQAILALTTSYPLAIFARVLIGAGDATAFLGAMRLLPAWFPLRATPLFTQLTAGVGQLGQFISAVPFLAVLHAAGWVPAFISLTTGGIIIAIVGLIALADVPTVPGESRPSRREHREAKKAARAAGVATTQRLGIGETLRIVTTHPVCWQGFFTHWTGLMHQCIFTLLWGMPLMTLGLGLTPAQASVVLIINTLAVIVAGPLMGMISARAGRARFTVIAAIAIADMAMWIVFLASENPPAYWAIILLNIGMGALGPMSNLGFDSVREHVDRKVLATGTGLANMGGFIATMIASQGVGLLLDYSAHGANYVWADFRVGWLAVIAIWVVGVVGLFASQVAVRRHTAARHKVTLD
nr:MFS transporter [Corynebacterium lactis]